MGLSFRGASVSYIYPEVFGRREHDNLDDDVMASVMEGVSEGIAAIRGEGYRPVRVYVKGETIESLDRVIARNGWRPAERLDSIMGLPYEVDDSLLLGAVRVVAT